MPNAYYSLYPKEGKFLKITYRNKKIYQNPTNSENISRVPSLKNILNTIVAFCQYSQVSLLITML